MIEITSVTVKTIIFVTGRIPKDLWCHSVHPLSAGGLNFQPNFQMGGGGLYRTSTFRGALLGKGGEFFQGVIQFSERNKLKSEIFNDKKSL